MTVYVESNFVVEHALQQEEYESCDRIVRLASRGSIELVIPAFSLAEPHLAIAGKEKVRNRLSHDLRTHLAELGRSRRHREIPARFENLASVLIASARGERDGLRETITHLLRCAQIIALDTPVLKLASDVEERYGLSGQDSIVLASVLSDLEARHPRESCFLNRNSKDFDDPGILEGLEALGCRFFPRFGEGLRYISSRLAAEDLSG
jgi:predicted nucleic acid-binding protein